VVTTSTGALLLRHELLVLDVASTLSLPLGVEGSTGDGGVAAAEVDEVGWCWELDDVLR